MGIRIEKITAKNLGPIQSFSQDLGLFNLIYSKNECGKTFLTEFITRCLFRNIKRWQFREKGSGKVIVSGLDCDNPVEFSPDTGKKLEDYWEKDQPGMPISMVKLLVSKGGEPSIENSDEGIGKSLIKEIFSGISLLDKIDDDKNISRTIKGSEFESGNIIISNTGEGKTYRQIKEDIARIDRLFADIESKYASGIIQSYRNEAKRLADWKSNLYKAKCYEAYLVSEKIKEVSKELTKKDEEQLNILYSDIAFYDNKKREYESKLIQVNELKEKCINYEWLQKALPLYEKHSSSLIKRPKLLFALLAGIFVLAAVIFSIFNIQIGTILSVLAATGFIIIYILRLLKFLKNAGFSEEFDKLKIGFKQRIGRELSDMAVLNEEIGRQQASYEKSKLLEVQLDELQAQNSSLKFSIQQKFYSLVSSPVSEVQWLDVYNDIKNEIRDLRDEIETWREKQVELAVRETDYLQEDPMVKFSYEEFAKVQESLDNIEDEISQKESQASALKHSVCNETGDDLTIEWEHLIENLRDKRIEKQNAFNILEAQIIAGIIIHMKISSLRQEEDTKIAEGLKSGAVLGPLKEITKKYSSLSLDGDRLVVSDEFKDYYIKDLSTGAREQIMLALRIGFSSKILKQDTLFIILDDALQHSDWTRRKILISKLAEIALSGWQVIYFSMDDHIKGLFEQAGKSFQKSEYKYIELP